MANFQSAADAIAAFDQFCDSALEMLEDPVALRQVETLKWANLSYDQRRFPMADPDHYHRTLRQHLATALGSQRYNLLAEGYYRRYRAARQGTVRRPTPRDQATVDLAGIRYQYRQAAERHEAHAGQASS